MLGDRAADFAPAWAAALSPAGDPLRYGGTALHEGRFRPALRLRAAAAAALLSLLAALFAPGLRAHHLMRVAGAELSALGEARSDAVVVERELASVTGALSELAAFDDRRQLLTLLLLDITRALPEKTALISLRVDSAGGSLVAVGPRGASVLAGIDHVPSLAKAEVLGPITREQMGAEELERVTVRFRLRERAALEKVSAGREQS